MRPRKLDSSYLSNVRLNPAVIRCNVEPAAGHLWYLLHAVRVMASQSDEMSDEENENNSDIDHIEVAIDAGATFSKPASALISRKRKIHANEGKYKQQN